MAASAGSVHRALDGRRFVYRGAVDLSHPASSTARVMVAGVLREFTSLPSWGAENMARLHGVALDESLSFQGGTLRIGHAVQKDAAGMTTDRLSMAVWDGRAHALVAHMYDAAGSADVLRLMRAVRITEHPDGIVIAPRPEAEAAFFEPVISAKVIPELGVVDAKAREARTVKALPPWQGAVVPAGELFRDSMGNGAPYLVLATPSAVATIVPRAEQPLADVARAAAVGFSVETIA
jgi:hypothetical protein